MQLHGASFELASVQEWIWSLKSEVSRERLNPMKPIEAEQPDVVTETVRQTIRIGFERTLQQDVTFGMRQLADVSCKALSPAINDPYTAVQAIDHLT
jgi:hypothetical protein